MIKICRVCGEEVDMMIGRNKYVFIDVSNGNTHEEICIEVEAEKCPNCSHINF